MFRKVEDAVAAVHERGIVIGDVHTFNILVRPDDTVVLIDFEGASDVAHAQRQVLAAPGFLAPRTATGFDIDRYALACLRLALFLPLTGLIDLDRGKAGQFAREAQQLFPVPHAFLYEAVRTITGDGGIAAGTDEGLLLEPDHAGWLRARESISAGILAAATPERTDRLFPGDIEQFALPGGGLDLAHGAAGGLYALDTAGAGRHPEHEEWLIRQALHPEPGTRLGFYNGMHGVAYVLEHLGHHGEAVKVLDMCLGEHWEPLARSTPPPPSPPSSTSPRDASGSSPPTGPTPPSRSCPRTPRRAATGRRRSGGRAAAMRSPPKIELGYGDGVLRIEAPAAKPQLFGPSGSAEVTVQLPAGSRVEATSSCADFRGVGRLGDVVLKESYGSVKLDEAASARLAALAGDVSVGRLGGDGEISTQKGDIRIAEAVRGTVTLRTEHGAISVDAAPGVSASLDAGTSYGRIHNALKNTEGAAAGLNIHATTGYGDITARSL
jgi:hypothetical protein